VNQFVAENKENVKQFIFKPHEEEEHDDGGLPRRYSKRKKVEKWVEDKEICFAGFTIGYFRPAHPFLHLAYVDFPDAKLEVQKG